jgi:DNA polymerase/3'-5' exonuclease PolX
MKMSTTDQRRGRAEAILAAEKFQGMFDGCYERWAVAGSIRRGRPDISDSEHVVIPRFGDVPARDLFGSPTRVNLLFNRMDELVANEELAKHVYTNGLRWGDKYRGVDQTFLGVTVMNEVFCADAENWGSVLAIRTGPAELSQRLVVGLRRGGYRNKEGYVWKCVVCCHCDGERGREPKCVACDGTGLEPDERVSVPDERTFFKLAGIAWAEPENRQ